MAISGTAASARNRKRSSADRRRIAIDGAGAQALQLPLVLRQRDQVLQRGRGQALARLLLADAVADFGHALLPVNVLEVGPPDQFSVFAHDDAGVHAALCVLVQELRDVRVDAVNAVKIVRAPVDMALEPGPVGLFEASKGAASSGRRVRMVCVLMQAPGKA